MTNKPMLSVERELLERLTENWNGTDARIELRALLDKPELCGTHTGDSCSYCGGSGLKGFQCQSDPVAEVQHGPFDNVGHPQWVRVATLGDFDLEHIPDGTKLFMAPSEQPAPVAVHTSALLGLLLSKITIDSRGFYCLSGIHPGNFNRALEVSGAELTQGISAYKDPVAAVMPELSEEEFEFLKAVHAYSGSKLHSCFGEDGNAIWTRLEEMGLIKCIGSYKWELTFDAVAMGITARLNGVKP